NDGRHACQHPAAEGHVYKLHIVRRYGAGQHRAPRSRLALRQVRPTLERSLQPLLNTLAHTVGNQISPAVGVLLNTYVCDSHGTEKERRRQQHGPPRPEHLCWCGPKEEVCRFVQRELASSVQQIVPCGHESAQVIEFVRRTPARRCLHARQVACQVPVFSYELGDTLLRQRGQATAGLNLLNTQRKLLPPLDTAGHERAPLPPCPRLTRRCCSARASMALTRKLAQHVCLGLHAHVRQRSAHTRNQHLPKRTPP